MKDYECRVCGKPFRSGNLNPQFCSKPCMGTFRRGKPRNLSPEVLESIAAAKRGDLNPSKRPEVRARISAAHKASGRFRRERHPNWKGGQWTQDGYMFVNLPDGTTVKRSHFVWNETHPDDPVLLGQVIHHMNHVKTDDRPENLMKLPGQREHVARHVADWGVVPGAKRLGRKRSIT